MQKSLTSTMMLVLSLLVMTGCGPKVEPEKDNPEIVEPQVETAFDSEIFLEEIKPALEYLESAEAEIYGAEVDFDHSYYAGYQEVNGQSELAVLIPLEETLPEGYVEDPAAASYYLVNNFTTIQEIKDYAMNYFLGDKIPNLDTLEYNFLAYEGKLYLCRGGRGYGTLLPKIDTVKYVGEENGEQIVTIDYYHFDEYDSTKTVHFVLEDNQWKIIDIISE